MNDLNRFFLLLTLYFGAVFNGISQTDDSTRIRLDSAQAIELFKPTSPCPRGAHNFICQCAPPYRPPYLVNGATKVEGGKLSELQLSGDWSTIRKQQRNWEIDSTTNHKVHVYGDSSVTFLVNKEKQYYITELTFTEGMKIQIGATILNYYSDYKSTLQQLQTNSFAVVNGLGAIENGERQLIQFSFQYNGNTMDDDTEIISGSAQLIWESGQLTKLLITPLLL